MKIAMLVRGFIPAPRPADMIYAPIDLAVDISKGLVERGHDVDFYGPLGTEIEGVNVVNLNLRPLVHDQPELRDLFGATEQVNHYIPALWDAYMANEMFARANRGEYDLLHFHHPEVALSLAHANQHIPVIYTLHDPIFQWYREVFELYQSPNQHYVSISKNQRRDAPDLPYAATVHNGINAQHYPFAGEPEDYLLFAGRVTPEKGVKEAVQVAKMTGKRLLIIGPTYGSSQGYFDQYIKPQLGDQVLYLGYVERDQMWRYYQKAQALLTPIQWEEPFGLTTIEAMACGTPVLSLRRGAAHELIVNGKTGFVVDSLAEMAAAVKKLDTIKRADCRDHVKEQFCVSRMVDGYEAAYKKVLGKRKKLSPQFVKTQLRRVPARLRTNLKKSSDQLGLGFQDIQDEHLAAQIAKAKNISPE
jgi:glycosyltransferase involved in cell wall biosynthesis